MRNRLVDRITMNGRLLGKGQVLPVCGRQMSTSAPPLIESVSGGRLRSLSAWYSKRYDAADGERLSHKCWIRKTITLSFPQKRESICQVMAGSPFVAYLWTHSCFVWIPASAGMTIFKVSCGGTHLMIFVTISTDLWEQPQDIRRVQRPAVSGSCECSS